MKKRGRSRSSRTICVGNLPDIGEKRVEKLFRKYGRVARIVLKITPWPPGYAFVKFEDARDAADAIRGRDGYKFHGRRLRVEVAHGGRGHSSSTDRHSGHKSGRGPRGGVSKHANNRVLITGLPHSTSWKDLEDHIGRGVKVSFAQFIEDGTGTSAFVDLKSRADMRDAEMRYAIWMLDGSYLDSCSSAITAKEYDSTSRSQNRSHSSGRSGSRSPSRSRSRSKSPTKKRSRRSRSRYSKSPTKKRSRRSRSRYSKSPTKKRSRRSRSRYS